MKTQYTLPPILQRILLQALAYLLWLVSAAVCIVAVIQLRSTVNVLWVALGGDRYSLGLVNQVILLVGGFAFFVYVIFLEGYYREAVTLRVTPRASSTILRETSASLQGRLMYWLARAGLDVLLWRFVLTIGVPLGVLGVSLLVLEIALRILL